MVSKGREEARTGVAKATRRKRRETPELNQEEEEILRAATLELITNHGGHFVATDLRETRIEGTQVWIVTVTGASTPRPSRLIGSITT
jgi:hypothetical protein